MRPKIEEILTEGGGGRIYRAILERIDTYREPHAFIKEGYRLYPSVYKMIKKKPKEDPSTSGRVFEYLICETLVREGIVPFYYQARFKQVPNADFDIVLYDSVRPVVLSAKVSLRERYKQADLEGFALKQVYRKANSYLITLDEKEPARIKRKIEAGDVAGLESCVRADKPAYDELLQELTQQSFSTAKEIMPISGKPVQGSNVVNGEGCSNGK